MREKVRDFQRFQLHSHHDIENHMVIIAEYRCTTLVGKSNRLTKSLVTYKVMVIRLQGYQVTTDKVTKLLGYEVAKQQTPTFQMSGLQVVMFRTVMFISGVSILPLEAHKL